MASRHDIVSITFQANAGKANVALQALQSEAKKSSDRVMALKKQLEEGLRANLPADQIKKIRNDIKSAEREVKQWDKAYRELAKGVRTLDEAVKLFNTGTLGQMSAAFNKAAANAAKLAQTKMTPGTQEWKEMDALIVEAQSNVLKANADINGLVSTLKKGGEVSKSTLTQAKGDLEQLLTLETRGSAEWNNYNRQLKVVSGELNKLAEAERKAAQADQTAVMNKRMRDLKTMSSSMLSETKRFWEQMVAGAEKGSAELTKYEANLKKVTNEERRRTSASAENVLANMDRFGVEQVRQAVHQMGQLRDNVQQGIHAWQHYNKLVKEGEAYLQEYAEREKIARGEAMSLADALRLSSTAGGRGFSGTSVQLQQAEAALQKASTTARKGSPEWVKYQEALARVRVEMQSAGMTSERMQAILAKPASAKNLNELQAAVKRAKAELDLMAGTVGKNNKAYTELAKRTKEAELQMKQLQSQSHGTASSFDKAWSRLKTYIGLYMGAAVAIQKLSATMGDLLELSDKMGEVRKTTGFTADEVGRLSDKLKKMDTRTTLTGLMDLSVAAGQLGLKSEQDVLGFTEAANKLMVALPEMGKEGATQMLKVALATGEIAKIQEQMDAGLIEGSSATAVAMEKVGSTIDRLRATSAATAPAITDFVKRVGAVGAQSGISIDQIAALGSTVDALGMRVEMSATALSRMMPAIRNNAFDIAKILGVTPNSIRELYDTGRGMEVILMILQKMRDSNMDADSIEQMLGMGGMKEIMKELNQQGARAGIVFGGLSQNVDELRRQLGIAKQAYEENIAIQQEYDKMNETAAAKWQRLKNQVEEMFVSNDSVQWLSTLIDWLRKLVDLIADDGPIGSFFRYSLVYLALFKAKWAEAMGTALISAGKFVLSLGASTTAATADAAAKTADAAATEAVGVASEGAALKTGVFSSAWSKLNKTMKANIIVAAATALLWLGTELYGVYKKSKDAAKQMDVMADIEKKAKEESIKQRAELHRLYEATKDQTKSMEERKKALREMVGDAKYKQYYANLSNESDFAKEAAKAYKELASQIIATARARALDAKAEELQRKRIELEDKKQEREQWREDNTGEYQKGLQGYQQQQQYVGKVTGGAYAGFQESQVARQGSAALKPAIINAYEANESAIGAIDNDIKQVDATLERLGKQISANTVKDEGGGGGGGTEGGGGGGRGSSIWGNEVEAASTDYSTWDVNELVQRRKQMNTFKNVLKPGIDVRKVLAEDKALMKAIDEGKVGEDWQSVLNWYNAERKKIQEELKSERFSTNEGNWRDEKTKKGRKRANPLLESDYALAELDRYYSRRKEALEKARSEENISEELYNRQLEMMEQEHLERRSKLRGTFTGEVSKAETKAFRKWWEDLEKMDELDHVPWATVESEWSKATAAQIGRNNLKMQQDMTQVESITMKHVNQIAKIISKERPYDGITESLQANLTKLDILFADLGTVTKKQLEDGSLTRELSSRLSFLLGEAEHAYSLTAEQLMSDMGEKGFKAWADAIASAENTEELKRQLLAQLQTAYDAVQDAIKKEANLIKKQAEIQWNDATMPNGKSQKQNYESLLSALGLKEDQVKRANQLIGAGQASERVADKLAIRQMKIRLAMQEQYFALMRKIGEERIRQLEAAGKMEDAEHLRKSLNLSLSEEQKKLDEQRVAIQNRLEESQNRLYTELKSWADLFSSSLQSMFEASHAGDPEYYNERAKLNLTGKGGPGAGTYVITDRAGTSGAKAHYEYLDERAALEREREIERQNAVADAWRKVMDDINAKMNDMITDQINAMLQNASIDTNTTAVNANTTALDRLSDAVSKGLNVTVTQMSGDSFPAIDENDPETWPRAMRKRAGLDVGETPHDHTQDADPVASAQVRIDASNAVTDTIVSNEQKQVLATKDGNDKIQKSTQSAFAKMTMAANLYGVAYQAMSNNNLSTAQKFQMIALQAVGNGAIAALTTNLAQTQGEVATQLPGILGKAASQLGPIAGPIAFAAMTALLGGLMGMAVSKIAKSKSQIAQVTGASVGAGRLTTGMLTYAEGNVNEFTDPSTLTPGRQYNVDAADGRTYRARYMGANPRTHLTNGPEFHLVGEKGREAIIDAHTTRMMQMDDNGIWKAIQTLYNGGSIASRRRRTMRRGVPAFAEGNMDEFEDVGDMVSSDGTAMDQMLSLQASIDRQSELLDHLRIHGIKATFDTYGKGGLIDSYDTGKKIVNSHGERY